MRRVAFADIATVLSAAALFVAIFHNLPSRQSYSYDEADYMTAARAGLAANIVERPSMSIVEFLRTGLNKNMRLQRGSLSEIVRGTKDITFLRHYHGPLYFYWLAIAAPILHFNEYAMRCTGIAFHILTFAVIYFGVLFLSGSRIAALLSSCLYLFGQSSILTATQITPHIPHVLFTMLTLVLFARYLQTGALADWYAAVIACAFAFCSIDYAVVLPITFAICLFLFKDRRLPVVTLLRSAVLFLGCLLALWPVGLLTLSLTKCYFFIVYLATHRGSSYGIETPFAVWMHRAYDAPVEYSLAAICAALFLYGYIRRRERPLLAPFFIYAAFMLMTTLENKLMNPTYVSALLPPLAVVGGVVLSSLIAGWKPALRNTATAFLLLAIVAGGYQLTLRREVSPPPLPEEFVMAALRKAHMEQAAVFVPNQYLPVLAYYFPGMKLHSYVGGEEPDIIIDKLRENHASAIVDNGGAATELTQTISRVFRLRAEPIDGVPGSTLFEIDGLN